MNKKISKMILLIGLASLVGLFFALDLDKSLTLAELKARQADLQSSYQQSPIVFLGAFALIYIASTALSLPGATLLTLAAGALFGFTIGTLVVSFASTIGATLAFLVSRFILQDSVKQRFPQQLERINKGIREEGAFYLFSLRLIPVFPFFLINLVMGVTAIRTSVYFIVSQIGMLAGTMAYVNAGTQISQIQSLQGILSPQLLGAFAVLGLLPVAAKRLVRFIRGSSVRRRFRRPKSYDYNLVVIGGGAAGLVSAYIAAALKAKVVLIEKHKMGGDCLNTGCVPSKALLRTAKILSYTRRASDFGLDAITPSYRFEDVMKRVHNVIARIEPHDSVERYTKLGVECLQGEARLVSPYEVEVNGRILTSRNIIIATGASPIVPRLKGLEKGGYLTSESLWQMREQPRRLVIIGGGPIGCEMAQAFQRLGTQVTVVEAQDRLLGREDDEAAQLVRSYLEKEGVRLLTGHRALEVRGGPEAKALVASNEGGTIEIPYDEILFAIGRRANVKGFGLEEVGIKLDDRGSIETDEYMRTNIPNILACGDVTSHLQFTHVASHQAWYASVNALLAPLKTFRVDNRVLPRVTYTDPEVASVGLTEQEALTRNIPFEITRYGIDDLDRAIADSEDKGFVKVLTKPGSDRILGAVVVGNGAGEILAELTLAMKHNLGLNQILGTVHAYPTMVEANKYAAGIWKRKTAPQAALKWAEKFHAFRRGLGGAQSRVSSDPHSTGDLHDNEIVLRSGGPIEVRGDYKASEGNG